MKRRRPRDQLAMPVQWEGTAAVERAHLERVAERLYSSPYAPPSAVRRAASILGRPVPTPALLDVRRAA